MNNWFLITWLHGTKERTVKKQGIHEVSEFVRNCDVNDRKLVKIEALED